MPITVVPKPYGGAAAAALAGAIADAKAGDPLAPVTVLVPTNSVGVAARRMLASGELGDVASRGRGVIGASFLTVLRLAELLAAPELAARHRRPVSTPVVAAALRRALGERPGVFAPVAQHPATEEALTAVGKELGELDDEQLDVLASQSRRAHEVVRLHRAARALLRDAWYDEHDLLRVAAEIVEAGEPVALRDAGAPVCYLLQRWSVPAARLVRALAQRRDVVAIVGLTGDAGADACVVASVARAGSLCDVRAVDTGSAAPTALVTMSDPDDEVRAVVRDVVDAMRSGVPLERMAIVYGTEEPYARLLHEHLEHAGIPRNGASVRALADTVLARALLRLLALPDGRFRRDDVCALIASAPVLDRRRRPATAVEWERISRAAGVVGGVAEWGSRLASYAVTLEATESDFGRREAARARALAEFVDDLARSLDAARARSTWRGLAEWVQRSIDTHFGDDRRRASWPPFEQECARRVEAIVERLGTLDLVDPAPSLDVFRRTLQLELEGVRARVGRLGEGVLVGPPALALGTQPERLWALGLAEGLFPSVPHDDPLLSDSERAAVGGALRLRADRVDDDARALLAVLASTTGARVCSYPRGDLRRSTEHVASRFVAPIDGDIVQARAVPSYAHAISHVAFPATPHELAVHAACADAPWIRAVPAVSRATELERARASERFTRFDGNLAELAPLLARSSPLAGRAISPSRLEQWALCPHAYFVRHILHVEALQRPEEIFELTPLDRGSLVHAVLDRFVDVMREAPAAGRPWTRADRARLREIAQEQFAETEARGITGRPLLWQREQRRILGYLDAFLEADSEFRAEYETQTLGTELSFGMADGPSVAVELSDGRTLLVRGKADRIDRASDGRLVVIDYKVGSAVSYAGLSPERPVLGGSCLQLPIYAHAARAAFGSRDTVVDAWYWFVGRGDNVRRGYAVDDVVDKTFDGAVRAIVEGIEAGVFIAVPPPPGPHGPFRVCAYCDPDGRGTSDRWREWERKYEAPELMPLRTVHEIDSDELQSAEIDG